MSLENLQAAIEHATSETHKRDFEVGGQMLTFPRLSIRDQGKFERYVRQNNPIFSLAATRNKAAMAMSGVLSKAKREMEKLQKSEDGSPIIENPEEAKRWAEKLQDDVMEKFEPYADKIFSGITRDHMLYGIALSMAAEYGESVTFTQTVNGNPEPVTVDVDSDFVDSLFQNEGGRVLENVFLWVVGLSDQAAGGPGPEFREGMTIDDIAKETMGDAENSEREQSDE